LPRQPIKRDNSGIGRRAYDNFRSDRASPAIQPAAHLAAGLIEVVTPCRQSIDAG
jgi:hypothetical protein